MGAIGAGGRTVLFVSHNMAAVRTLCSRAVLLDAGEIVAAGTPSDMVALYSRTTGGTARVREWTPSEAPGDAHCRLLRVELTQNGSGLEGQADSSLPLGLTIRFRVERPSRKLQIGFDLLTADRLSLFQSYHTDLVSQNPTEPGDFEVRCQIPAGLLNKARYIISPMVALYFTEWVVRHDPGAELQFDVNLSHPASPMWYTQREGALAPALEWRLSPVGAPIAPASSSTSAAGVDASA